MNGYDAQDMATQGADGFRNGYQAGYADAVKAIEAAQPAAAQEAVGVDAYDDALDQLWKLAGGNDHPVYKRFLEFRDSLAAPAPAAPTLDDELAQDRMSELCKLESDVLDVLPSVYYMDPPDGGDVSLGEQVKRMAEDAANWRKHASTPAAPGIDNTTLVDRGALQMAINVLRRAGKDEVADALADARPKGELPELPDDFSDSKDWRAGSYAERIEWLKDTVRSQREHIDALLDSPAGMEGHYRQALERITSQGPHYGPDGTRETWQHWSDIARDALADSPKGGSESQQAGAQAIAIVHMDGYRWNGKLWQKDSPKEGIEAAPDDLSAFLRWCADELTKRDNTPGMLRRMVGVLKDCAYSIEYVARVRGPTQAGDAEVRHG